MVQLTSLLEAINDTSTSDVLKSRKKFSSRK